MPLIKDGRLIEDAWLAVSDDEPLPLEAWPIIGLERWGAEREALLARNTPLGIRLRSDHSPALVADDLEHFALVALEFPKFADGRAFSSARLLRERYGYKGEVRAVGAPALDQALFLRRCGFDVIEVPEGTSAEAWLAAEKRISVVYQPAADGRAPAYRLRHAIGSNRARAEAKGSRSEEAMVGKAARPRITAEASDPCSGHWAY